MAAPVSVSYPVLTDRAKRAKLALGAVAWAYLNELAQGDFVNATGLLSLFQQLFNEHRSSVLTGFDPADRAAADAMIPRALVVHGAFDEHTRTALVAALIGVGINPSDADSMPTTAGQLGGWFAFDIADFMPRDGAPGSTADFLWDIANVASTASMANAAADVQGALLPFIEGGANAVSAPPATQAANEEARRIASQATRTTANQSRSNAPSLFELPGMLVTARASRKGPDWGFWVVMAGGVALAGVLGYQVWRVSKGKRRRRRRRRR